MKILRNLIWAGELEGGRDVGEKVRSHNTQKCDNNMDSIITHKDAFARTSTWGKKTRLHPPKSSIKNKTQTVHAEKGRRREFFKPPC